MTKDILEVRMKELVAALNESAENFQRLKTQIDNVTNNHNSLVGRLEEVKEMYGKLDKSESENPVEVHVAE